VGIRLARSVRSVVGVALVFVAACAYEQEQMASSMPSPTAVPILTLMVDVVAPATNTLWGVDNPETDVEWRELADAAELAIRAFRQIKEGGIGPNDMAWAADPRWQAYSDAVISTAEEARIAIEHRDPEALRDANNDLYAPCEACHLEFHPTIRPEES
jgi:hypothetical protein